MYKRIFGHLPAYGTTRNETNPVHDEITLRREKGKLLKKKSIPIEECRESASPDTFVDKKRFYRAQILRKRYRASRDKIPIAQITSKQE